MIQIYSDYPLVMINSLLLKMAIEIVSFPIKHGDFPVVKHSQPLNDHSFKGSLGNTNPAIGLGHTCTRWCPIVS